jgi:hypothetical protein
MLGQLGCKLFRSPKLSTHSLRQKLQKHYREVPEEGLTTSLIESVEDFRVSQGRVRLTFFFDQVISVPHRDGVHKIVRTAQAEVAIIDPPVENLYFIYGRASVADGVRARLSQALAGDNDFMAAVPIPSARLRKLLESDAVELKYGWWDGIDIHARKGALKGNVFQSKYYAQFKKAEPTAITFESKSSGRTIRLGVRGTVTFFGQDVSNQELEEYVTETVLVGD